MLRAARVLAAFLLVVCSPLNAAAKWTTLRSTNFVFVGDASERQIRDIAQQLEKFRDVVARLLPGVTASPAPTVVFVFATDQSFRPYTPRFDGRLVEVGGYLVGSDDVNYIAVNAEQRELALRTVFHEYTHFLAANSRAALPVWAGEGLAQVYESFQERDGGRRAVIGIPAKEHVDLLRGSTLMPLAQLLAVDHQSSMYNEGSRRSVFYAQSWALMHYLMLGSPARATQLRDYLATIRTGTPPQQAFRDAFGADDRVLERELFDYVRQYTFPATQYTFEGKVAEAVSGRGSTIEDAEAQGYLGDIIARLGRQEDARALLRAAMTTRPGAIRPVVALALLELRQGKLNEAMTLLEGAVSRSADDPGANAALGRALIEQLRESSQTDRAVREALLERARSVLARAVALDPTVAQTVAMLASVELTIGNAARATTLIEQALGLAPGHEQYRLMAAEALIAQREFDRATTYLGPLVASGSRQSIRDTARQLLGSAATQRAASQRGVAPPSVTESSAPSAASLPVTLAGLGAEPPPPARIQLDLRPIREGETRVLGVFRAIECSQGAIAIVLDADGRTLRLGAQTFDQIEFITYRSDQPGSVACGAQAGPGRVLATYRPDGRVSGQSDGVAVAIELLPDGYIPR